MYRLLCTPVQLNSHLHWITANWFVSLHSTKMEEKKKKNENVGYKLFVTFGTERKTRLSWEVFNFVITTKPQLNLQDKLSSLFCETHPCFETISVPRQRAFILDQNILVVRWVCVWMVFQNVLRHSFVKQWVTMCGTLFYFCIVFLKPNSWVLPDPMCTIFIFCNIIHQVKPPL